MTEQADEALRGVENGERVTFEGSAGLAGLVTINGRTTLAYAPVDPDRTPKPGDTVKAGGRSWTVTTRNRVDVAKGVRLIQLGLTLQTESGPEA